MPSFTSLGQWDFDDIRLISATLDVRFRDSKTAKVVDNALSPDNINLPRGMKIAQSRRGKSIKIVVSVDREESLDTLISTLDEFVAHMQVALNAIMSSTNDQ